MKGLKPCPVTIARLSADPDIAEERVEMAGYSFGVAGLRLVDLGDHDDLEDIRWSLTHVATGRSVYQAKRGESYRPIIEAARHAQNTNPIDWDGRTVFDGKPSGWWGTFLIRLRALQAQERWEPAL